MRFARTSPSSTTVLAIGVGAARRAWLRREDVLNTLPVERLLTSLGRVH